MLLEDIGAVLYRLWKWSISKERSSFEAPTPATKAATLPAIDPSAHRYPYCLVWTPIHPITWVAPYVGHVGLCDEEGVVLDFAGKHVGRDAMAFGWPARYVQLSPFVNEEINWDGEIGRAKQQFRRVEYNFLTVRSALPTLELSTLSATCTLSTAAFALRTFALRAFALSRPPIAAVELPQLPRRLPQQHPLAD